MVAPRIFVLTPAPCSMGTIRLFSPPFPTGIKVALSIYGLHHNPSSVAESRGTMAMKEGGMGCSLHTNPPPAPALRVLSPGGLGKKFDPTCPRLWCSLCRCLTHLGLHWVLINTAMLSLPFSGGSR